MARERNRSSNPGSNRDGNRGPGRAPRSTSGIESGEVPTEPAAPVAQASVLGAWAANSPDQPVVQGPWEPIRPDLQDEDPDEELEQGPELDPDLAFGEPAQPRADPLPAGARVSDGASDSEGRTKGAGSTGSSLDGGKPPNPLQARGRAAVFTKLAAAGFAALSAILNDRLAVDEQDETWLADDDDLDAVGKPAGRLIARKLPLPEGTDTNDLADAIEIAIGVAGYVAANTREWVKSVRLRRRAAAGAAVYEGD